MGFFGQSQNNDSLGRIESGGIPVASERRLRGLAGEEDALFTSALSVKELALLDRIGRRPLAQVLGASVYKVGWQYLPALDPRLKSFRDSYLDSNDMEPGYDQKRAYRWHETVLCELDTITRAWDQARRRALDRLAEEANQVGADAVVGVHLHRGEHEWGNDTIDYVIWGTAIRSHACGVSPWPVLSDLSLQDYWRLYQAGCEPVGLLATTAVIFVSAAQSTRLHRLRTVREAQEHEELSRAFHAARDTVRARLRGQVDAQNGNGAVGITLSHTVHRKKLSLESSVGHTRPGWYRGQMGLPYYTKGSEDIEREGWVITMHGAGTAIRAGTEAMRAAPETVIRLTHN